LNRLDYTRQRQTVLCAFAVFEQKRVNACQAKKESGNNTFSILLLSNA